MDAVGHYTVNYRFRRNDGTYIFVEDQGQFIADDSGKAVRMLGRMSDITARKQAEEMNQELTYNLEQRVRERTAELQHANKELETFSYSVSHDLRAPLRIIDGFSGILLEEHSSQIPPEAAQIFTAIRANAKRMGQLIDDLLMLSFVSRQPVNKTPIDMKVLVTDIADEMRSQEPQRNINVHVGALPICSADLSLLKQVFINLLSNAFKFTRHRDPAEIEIGAKKIDDEIVYFVRDNGAGFDPTQATNLFAPFERLHKASQFEGTGIGLSIVQRIIQRHGGRVWAESDPGNGATFCFTLPGDD